MIKLQRKRLCHCTVDFLKCGLYYDCEVISIFVFSYISCLVVINLFNCIDYLAVLIRLSSAFQKIKSLELSLAVVIL